MFASILKRADGFLEGWKVGKEGPGSLEVWWPFLTVLALMVWGIGCGRRRDKRLIAAGTCRLLEWVNGLPTHGTEEGHWVSAERGATCEAFDRQYKPEGLTAPSDQPTLCIFARHRRRRAPVNILGRFFYENVPLLSRLLLCKWL